MQTVSSAVKKIMLSEPFYGLFLCGINKRFTEKIPTAAVGLEGINYCLMINKDFWYGLKDDYRYAILKHELLHLCFFHLSDLYNKASDNHMILNIAMDLEVESYIDEKYWVKNEKGEFTGAADRFFELFPSLPKQAGTKYYLEYLKHLEKKAFEEVDKGNPQTPQSSNGQQDQGSSSQQGNPQSGSGSSNGSKSSQQSGKSSSGSKSSSGRSNRSRGENPEYSQGDQPNPSKIDKEWNDLSDSEKQQVRDQFIYARTLHSTWDDLKNLPEEEQKLIKEQLKYQLKQVAQSIKDKGNIPGELSVLIDELLNPRPPVFNWKAYFRRLLGTSFDINLKKTRRKESLRFEDAFGLKKKKKHKILVAIDTSGSVSNADYVDFFNEINHIYKAGADIHVLECDTQIAAEYDFKGKIPSQRCGNGGTSFQAPVQYFNDHRNDYSVCVYLTDGYGDQELCHPLGKMIWIITSDGNQGSNYPGIKVCIPETIKK